MWKLYINGVLQPMSYHTKPRVEIKEDEVRVCRNCTEHFLANRKDKKFCSTKCRVQYFRR